MLPGDRIAILALDQSTTATGVAYAVCSEDRQDILYHTCLESEVKGDTMADRLSRLMDMRHDFIGFVNGLGAIDLIAFEQPFFSKQSTNWDASPMALGALLTIPRLRGVEVVPVMRQAGCAVAGCGALYRQSAKTAREKADKRKRLKAEVIAWARQNLGLQISEEGSDVADAATIAIAAYREWAKAEEAKRNAALPLFGAGSRRRGKAAVK